MESLVAVASMFLGRYIKTLILLKYFNCVLRWFSDLVFDCHYFPDIDPFVDPNRSHVRRLLSHSPQPIGREHARS
jgi:hypothetical protein